MYAQPRSSARPFLIGAVSCAVLVLLAIGFETWTNNPSWIKDGVFGFEPLHGGAGRFSFPSGHTTLITAPLVVLWICVPRLRMIWAALIALVVIGLLSADYHWLSDTIAGFYLGTATAVGMIALLRAKP